MADEQKERKKRRQPASSPPPERLNVREKPILWKPRALIQCPACKKRKYQSGIRDVVCYAARAGVHYLRCNVCDLRFKAIDPREKRLAEARQRAERDEITRANLKTAGIRLRMAVKEFRASRRTRDDAIAEIKRARAARAEFEAEAEKKS